MLNCRNWVINYHSWTSPSHDFFDAKSHIGTVAMYGTILTSWLFVCKFAA